MWLRELSSCNYYGFNSTKAFEVVPWCWWRGKRQLEGRTIFQVIEYDRSRHSPVSFVSRPGQLWWRQFWKWYSLLLAYYADQNLTTRRDKPDLRDMTASLKELILNDSSLKWGTIRQLRSIRVKDRQAKNRRVENCWVNTSWVKDRRIQAHRVQDRLVKALLPYDSVNVLEDRRFISLCTCIG